MRWFRLVRCLAFATLINLSIKFPNDVHAAEAGPNTNSGETVVHVIRSSGTPEPDAAVSLFIFDRDWQTFKKMPRDTVTDSAGVCRGNRPGHAA